MCHARYQRQQVGRACMKYFWCGEEHPTWTKARLAAGGTDDREPIAKQSRPQHVQ